MIYRQEKHEGEQQIILSFKWKIQNFICLGHLPHNVFYSVSPTFIFSASAVYYSPAYVCISLYSPGRSPSCYDNEIVMMNHVYKERFPKVRLTQTSVNRTHTLIKQYVCKQCTCLLIVWIRLSATNGCRGWTCIQNNTFRQYIKTLVNY